VTRIAKTRHYLTIGQNCGRAVPLPEVLVRRCMVTWNRIACRIWGHWWLATASCPFGPPHEGGCAGCGARVPA
jgi:hypothetical protein